jgi:hypothetical protein
MRSIEPDSRWHGNCSLPVFKCNFQSSNGCLKVCIAANHSINTMKASKLILAAAAAALFTQLTAGTVLGQERRERGGDRGGDRGNFDPEQFRARAMERYREALEIKNDDEWKVIEPRIQKVSDARRNASSGFGPGGFGRGGFGGGRRDESGGGGAGGGGNGGADRRRSMFGGEPNPDAEALQKAIEAKAPSEEIKTKLAKYRESQKSKQAALTAAQDDLRKILSVRQEATAVMLGLLQ